MYTVLVSESNEFIIHKSRSDRTEEGEITREVEAGYASNTIIGTIKRVTGNLKSVVDKRRRRVEGITWQSCAASRLWSLLRHQTHTHAQ